MLVRNKKSQPVRLTVFDQLPVAAISDITVENVQLSNAKHNPETGQVRWELELKPQEQKEWMFRYEVKYPKRETVALE